MEGRFEDILSSVAEKPGRSRLEPYAELIDELHRRKLTCRRLRRSSRRSATFRFQRARSTTSCERDPDGRGILRDELPLRDNRRPGCPQSG